MLRQWRILYSYFLDTHSISSPMFLICSPCILWHGEACLHVDDAFFYLITIDNIVIRSVIYFIAKWALLDFQWLLWQTSAVVSAAVGLVPGLEPFYVELAYFPWLSVSSRQVLGLPVTIQKHTCEVNWNHEIDRCPSFSFYDSPADATFKLQWYDG